MCEVIVVDEESFRSTCFGGNAYIHDHFLGYRHNYLLFCQLPNSNLSTHHMLVLMREATSEHYGLRGLLLSYDLLLVFILKIPKIFAAYFYLLFYLRWV